MTKAQNDEVQKIIIIMLENSFSVKSIIDEIRDLFFLDKNEAMDIITEVLQKWEN